MIGINNFGFFILGMISVLLSQAFSVWGFYKFEQWLKSRHGQKKYTIKKRKRLTKRKKRNE